MKNFLLNNLVFAQEEGISMRELTDLSPLTTWDIVMRYINFFSLSLLPVALIFLILGLMRLAKSKSEKDKAKSGKTFLIISIAIFATFIISFFLGN